MPYTGQVEVLVAEVRNLARGSAHVAEVVEAAEDRYGDLGDLLDAVEWVSPDTAIFVHVDKHGKASELKHNAMPGQLITALEKGFLPISLAKYQEANPSNVPELVAGVDVPSNAGMRATGSESERISSSSETSCVECERSFATVRGLNSHRRQPGHIRRVEELQVT